jgi:hypothetical protein
MIIFILNKNFILLMYSILKNHAYKMIVGGQFSKNNILFPKNMIT